MRRRVPLLVLTLLSVLSVSLPAQQKPALKVRAALVTSDLSVRPVPLHEMELISLTDTTARTPLRTGLDGTARISVVPGSYLLRSIKPATLADSAYQWEIQINVALDGAEAELTNANAKTSGVKRVAARQVAPEREVFETVKSGVFRVEAGMGHGSGFLIDRTRGLLATNEHVVANATEASVYVDTITRLPAQIVARDRVSDIAILRIAPSRCVTCAQIPLASGNEVAVVGERIIAVGFPLSQEMTLTTGIVSSLRDGGIISDVNINPGNSGGPMLNLAGEAVAINTFLDPSNKAGPGVSGAVSIAKLAALLGTVDGALASMPQPEDRLLPAMPRVTYPADMLRQMGQDVRFDEYKDIVARNVGRFVMTITTPVLFSTYRNKAEAEMSKDRKKREAKAGISADNQYAGMAIIKDWEKFVGSEATPVVSVEIVPRVAETLGSALGRAFTASMIGVAGKATLKFQGDVRAVRFFRNGVEVEPLRGGHGPQEVYEDNGWVQLKDVADRAYYVIAPETFAPDSDGTPAAVSIVIEDLKHQDDFEVIDIRDRMTARIWNDFVPYFEKSQPDRKWTPANGSRHSPSITVQCDRGTRACRPTKG